MRFKGYTLIELLVTVTLIVVLLALLVPGLDAAMRACERVRCASNLGTIGRGIGMYVADLGKIPQRGDDKGNPAGDGWDNGFRAGGSDDNPGLDGPVIGQVPASKRPLYRYASPDAFRCPNDDIAFESRGTTYKSLWEQRGSSYWMQPSADVPDMTQFYLTYFAGGGGYGPYSYFSGVIGRKFAAIERPHKLIVMSDAPAWFTPYSFGAIAYSFHDDRGRQESAEGREHAWNPCLFADGRVEYLRIEGVQDDFVTSDYSFAYHEFDAGRMGSRGQ